jgi:hypothetical protein
MPHDAGVLVGYDDVSSQVVPDYIRFREAGGLEPENVAIASHSVAI